MNSLNEYRSCVERYIANCIVDSKSSETIQNYSARLNRFGEFLAENGMDCSEDAVMAWKLHLAENGMKVSSIAEYLRELRQFCQWADDIGSTTVRFSVPDRLVPKVKARPYEKLLTEEEIIAVMRGVPKDGKRMGRTWMRDHAMVITFMESAMRASELAAVAPKDIDWEHGTIYVPHGKGNKARTVAFPEMAQEEVSAYMASGMRPAWLSDADPIFGILDKENGVWKTLEA